MLGIAVLSPFHIIDQIENEEICSFLRVAGLGRLAALRASCRIVRRRSSGQWPLMIGSNGRGARGTLVGKIAAYGFNATDSFFYELGQTVNFKVKFGCVEENHWAT